MSEVIISFIPLTLQARNTRSNVRIEYKGINLCWVPYTKEEANMDKPRIAQVLGVEVGEDVKYRHTDGSEENLCVCEDGRVIISSLSCKITATSVLINAINHPDRIIRKPRWTEQEVEIVKNLLEVVGPAELRKVADMVTMKVDGKIIYLRKDAFPSLKNEMVVTLYEIIGGAE